MMQHTAFDKQSILRRREPTVRRRAATAAAAFILLAAPLAARGAGAAAPPPVPVATGRALPAPAFPALGDGTAGPGHLLPRTAPAEAGAALPVPHRPGEADAAGGVHVVRAGETLWSVALRYADDRRSAQAMFEALLQANRSRFGGDAPDLIFPGERLRLPARGTASHG